MNCADFENYLPEAEGDAYPPEVEQHLRSCGTCTQLATDLRCISQVAPELRDCDTPGPLVWNSIEAALMQEGLIRESSARPFLVQASARRWQPGWLLPLAAAFIIAFGITVYERGAPRADRAGTIPGGGAVTSAHKFQPDDDDQRLLAEMNGVSPAVRTAYETGLSDTDAYIRDAKARVDEDPNDEQAQGALVAAYEQRSMIYHMASERSLQ
jgi:hypothetical protein